MRAAPSPPAFAAATGDSAARTPPKAKGAPAPPSLLLPGPAPALADDETTSPSMEGSSPGKTLPDSSKQGLQIRPVGSKRRPPVAVYQTDLIENR